MMIKATGEDDASDDSYDIFESALETLFDQHQPASGKPGSRRQLQLSESVILKYRIPLIEKASNNRLFAHYQWDAGQVLAAMLFESTQDKHDGSLSIPLIGRDVVELGAGTGLPALTCARLGAAKVCITDYPDEGILKAIKENIAMNEFNHIATVKGLDWGDTRQLEEVVACSFRTYDLILCADVLWLSTSHDDLLRTITTLLKRSISSRVLVISGFHTGRRALLSFFRKALLLGLCPDKDFVYDGIFEQHATSSIRRSWSGSFPFPHDQHSTGDLNLQDNMDDYTERRKWLLCVSLRWKQVNGGSNLVTMSSSAINGDMEI